MLAPLGIFAPSLATRKRDGKPFATSSFYGTTLTRVHTAARLLATPRHGGSLPDYGIRLEAITRSKKRHALTSLSNAVAAASPSSSAAPSAQKPTFCAKSSWFCRFAGRHGTPTLLPVTCSLRVCRGCVCRCHEETNKRRRQGGGGKRVETGEHEKRCSGGATAAAEKHQER